MSATYSVEPGPPGHPLGKGASPVAIRSALFAEDRLAFDEAYAAALAEARDSLDLTGLFIMLERWRGIAVLHSDPDRFVRVARRAAEKLTGEPSPDDEPLAVTRRKAQLQVYRLDDSDVLDHLDSLPPAALTAYAELRATLEVAPWSGDSSSTRNPGGAVRVMSFACEDGSGFVYYLILERERRVDVLDLVWFGQQSTNCDREPN